MKLNSKVTGGLAWAGLILILAVPSADMLTKPRANAVGAATADITETASIAPAATPAVTAVKPAVKPLRPVEVAAAESAGTDPVDTYIASGKKLPSYISDAPVSAAQALQPVATEPLVVGGTQAGVSGTAAADGKVMNLALVAPEPYPASMRPGARSATAALPAGSEAPLILDEDAVARREATLRAVGPVLEDEPRVIEQDMLQEWDSGSLADYLERKGLISDADQAVPVESNYDPDGYYLDEGPNRSGARLIRRLDNRLDFFLF